jgi:hypothetical protein
VDVFQEGVDAGEGNHVTFAYGSDSFTGTLANDDRFCRLPIEMQAIELDPGDAKGVSFAHGLELILGD